MPTAPFLVPERDTALKVGRGKRALPETYICVPGVAVISSGNLTISINFDIYAPWSTPTPLVIDQLLAEVTTANGTNFRIGFYRADVNWQPIGAPLADSGNLSSASTGVKTYTPGTPIYVQRGRYVSVVNSDSAPALRCVRAQPLGGFVNEAIGASPFVERIDVGRAYAAFPTPGTAWSNETLSTTPLLHPVYYRVSTP